jgi:hypothetical protein
MLVPAIRLPPETRSLLRSRLVRSGDPSSGRSAMTACGFTGSHKMLIVHRDSASFNRCFRRVKLDRRWGPDAAIQLFHTSRGRQRTHCVDGRIGRRHKRFFVCFRLGSLASAKPRKPRCGMANKGQRRRAADSVCAAHSGRLRLMTLSHALLAADPIEPIVSGRGWPTIS